MWRRTRKERHKEKAGSNPHLLKKRKIWKEKHGQKKKTEWQFFQGGDQKHDRSPE